MTSLTIPRAVTPVLSQDGTFSREWYKSLQSATGSLNTSLLSADIYTDTGTVNAAKIQSGISAYTRGLTRYFVPKFTNTSTAVTLNDSGLGAEAIVLSDGTLPAVGSIVATQTTQVIFNGTAWELQASSGSSESIPGNLTVAGTSALDGAVTAGSTIAATGAISSSAAVSAGTSVTAATYVASGATVVGSLPSAATAGAGARYFVTDATATTFASTVAGGSSHKVPVVSDGTNWIIG